MERMDTNEIQKRSALRCVFCNHGQRTHRNALELMRSLTQYTAFAPRAFLVLLPAEGGLWTDTHGLLIRHGPLIRNTIHRYHLYARGQYVILIRDTLSAALNAQFNTPVLKAY